MLSSTFVFRDLERGDPLVEAVMVESRLVRVGTVLQGIGEPVRPKGVVKPEEI